MPDTTVKEAPFSSDYQSQQEIFDGRQLLLQGSPTK